MDSKITGVNDREICITYNDIETLLDRQAMLVQVLQQYLDTQDNVQYISDVDIIYTDQNTFKLRMTLKPSDYGNN